VPDRDPCFHLQRRIRVGLRQLTATAATGSGSWSLSTQNPKTGVSSAFRSRSQWHLDHRLSMNAPVVIPVGGRLYFDHAFGFERDDTFFYDGGRPRVQRQTTARVGPTPAG